VFRIGQKRLKLRASAKLGAIAVDESVVKCGGRPVYVWVAVDAVTRQPISFGVSLTRTTENAL
jgi:hypothetical protein